MKAELALDRKKVIGSGFTGEIDGGAVSIVTLMLRDVFSVAYSLAIYVQDEIRKQSLSAEGRW